MISRLVVLVATTASALQSVGAAQFASGEQQLGDIPQGLLRTWLRKHTVDHVAVMLFETTAVAIRRTSQKSMLSPTFPVQQATLEFTVVGDALTGCR